MSSAAVRRALFVLLVIASARADIVAVCNNARSDGPAFRKSIDDVLSRLLGDTPSAPQGEVYAALERGADWVVYGKAKCTHGFTRCLNCIDDALSAFGKLCPGAWGAHLADDSAGCLVQYELSDFQLS